MISVCVCVCVCIIIAGPGMILINRFHLPRMNQARCVIRSGPERERPRDVLPGPADARVCRVLRPTSGGPGFVYLRSARVRLIIKPPSVCVCVVYVVSDLQIWRSFVLSCVSALILYSLETHAACTRLRRNSLQLTQQQHCTLALLCSSSYSY